MASAFMLTLRMFFDPMSGHALVYSIKDEERIPFKPEDWQIPEEFRRFMEMRGDYINHYVRRVDRILNLHEIDAEIFLDIYFPQWINMKDKEEWDKYDWNEETHNQFRKCLEWCVSKGRFNISWA